MTAQPEWFDTNRASWDERVPIHVRSRMYDVEGFKQGADPLKGRPFEPEEMGDVSGKRLVHLQCHFGLDTFGWARRGARVTGLDFSAPAVEQARALAAEVGLEADFVQANLYDAIEALGGRRFDIVYTGRGALCWLPDIHGWARIVAALLVPGGFLYLSEFHPLHEILAVDELVVRHDYFHGEPKRWDEPGDYADATAVTENNVTFEWTHGLGEVVSSLIEAGLRIEFLHEFEYTGFQRFPFLERGEDEVYRMPAGMPRIPLAYTLKATKPR
jgi:SAM-dependent methyltransferase